MSEPWKWWIAALILAAGCARTEGYYKISYQEKSQYLVHTRGVHQADVAAGGEAGLEPPDPGREIKKKVHLSREARSESRRWLSILSSQGEDYGDLLKFNQLKVYERRNNNSNSSSWF